MIDCDIPRHLTINLNGRLETRKGTEFMAVENNILRVLKDGTVLELMDGSRWEIPVGNNTMTLIWLPTARVTIEENEEDEMFPYRITNLDTYGPEVVRARRTV
jgi:hypothetical protein